MRQRLLARASAVLLTTTVLLGTMTIRALAAEPAPVSEADLTYFYKMPSPELAARLVAHFDALRTAENPGARPPLIGFFAAAFQRYPADLDRMIPGSLSPQMSDLLAVSLRLAGQQARAQALVEKLEAQDVGVTDPASTPSSLEAIEPAGPSEWDLLWGASFATGDPRFCSKILKRFAATANIGANADDLVHLVRDKEDGRTPAP